MDVPDGLLLLLVIALVAGWALAFVAARKWRDASRGARRQAAKQGAITEQYAPWMKGWPFARADGFRFLGAPIDGVQFEEDAIFLVEIKSGASQLSPQQRRIRDLVLAGRVGWAQFNAGEGRAVEVVRPWERR